MGLGIKCKTAPYIIDEETWQLMNKLNKRNEPKAKDVITTTQESVNWKEIFETIINRTQ